MTLRSSIRIPDCTCTAATGFESTFGGVPRSERSTGSLCMVSATNGCHPILPESFAAKSFQDCGSTQIRCSGTTPSQFDNARNSATPPQSTHGSPRAFDSYTWNVERDWVMGRFALRALAFFALVVEHLSLKLSKTVVQFDERCSLTRGEPSLPVRSRRGYRIAVGVRHRGEAVDFSGDLHGCIRPFPQPLFF